MTGRHPHLLDFAGWTPEDIQAVLATSKVMAEVLQRPVKKVPALQGYTVCTVFFEASTRTRLSFEIAARRQSADVVTFTAATSSLVKGESVKDTLETLDAMQVDCFVVRHQAAGVPHQIARWTDAAVVNAGDGLRAHPTQALLDAYTLIERIGDLSGAKVAIVGDILHSRVARSNVECLTKLGAEVWCAGPPTLLPPGGEELGCRLTTRIEEALEGARAVMALRLQNERMTAGYLPSVAEYVREYQIDAARFALAAGDALLMHPGPVNQDVEVSSQLAASERSVIVDQVASGVPVRMAVLYHLLVGRHGGERK